MSLIRLKVQNLTTMKPTDLKTIRVKKLIHKELK